ncbi:hypothetical protein HDU76_009646 [Blyttiomyces sp. JEL0837]|nr:hypothetical protein HDU76_009646 [Blyttiomyces sp. JEL0837]
MGHELTHGFDSSGRAYDAEGLYRDWWSKKTSDAFNSKAQCFIEQYGNYSVAFPDGEVLYVNGVATLGENIADNGGLARAFDAWKVERNAVGGGRKNPILPGFDNFTEEQMFFLSFANLWCSATRPEQMRNRILGNEHSPPEFRVKGTVSNSPEFAKAFNCRVGSNMNPAKKCKIW